MYAPSLTPKIYKAIAIIFLIIVIILGALIAHFSLARAVIIIEAKQEKISTKIVKEVPIAKHQKENLQEKPLDLQEGIEKIKQLILNSEQEKIAEENYEDKLQAEIIQTEISHSQSFTAKGPGKEIEDIARGKVMIINDSNRNQPLVKNTRLLSLSGELFRIVEYVNVPANGTVEVEVVADQLETKGKLGNIEATSFTIPGLNQTRQKEVYAESSQAFFGGVKIIKAISAEDITQAEKNFKETLENKGLVELNKQDSRITLKDIQAEIKEIKADSKAGEEKENFTIQGKAVVYGVILDKEKLLTEAGKALQNSMLNSQTLLSIEEDSFNYQIIEFNYPENIKIEAALSGFAALKEAGSITQKNELIGLSADEIQEKILTNKAVTGVNIKLWPFWVTKVPRFKNHIEILIKPVENAEKGELKAPEVLEEKYLAPEE